MLNYYRPDNLNDGLVALSENSWTLLAGGTDFYPARVGKHLNEKVMDLTGIRELRSIRETEDQIYIGALTTWTDIVSAKLPEAFEGLRKASKTIGGVQTQNAGTICGNICNASPAADSVPNLMALDAKVQLMSVKETRMLPLEEFILGNRKTARKSDEFVTGLIIPHPGKDARGKFLKIGIKSISGYINCHGGSRCGIERIRGNRKLECCSWSLLSSITETVPAGEGSKRTKIAGPGNQTIAS